MTLNVMILIATLLFCWCFYPSFSVPDPWHFDSDPDPLICSLAYGSGSGSCSFWQCCGGIRFESASFWWNWIGIQGLPIRILLDPDPDLYSFYVMLNNTFYQNILFKILKIITPMTLTNKINQSMEKTWIGVKMESRIRIRTRIGLKTRCRLTTLLSDHV